VIPIVIPRTGGRDPVFRSWLPYVVAYESTKLSPGDSSGWQHRLQPTWLKRRLTAYPNSGTASLPVLEQV